MEVGKAIFERRSVRFFNERQIDTSILREILIAGIYAPSAGNLQPWEFYCYCQPDSVDRIRSVSPGIMGKPKAIIVACMNEKKIKEQKERCLIPAIKGEKVGTIAFTEPNCGSDLGSIQTYAKKEGDGYILNGRKMWITNGAVADFVTVVASIDPSKRINGLAFFLVEKGTPGFSVGQKIEKISAKGANTAELIFDNCYLPKENLLGEEGKGVIYLEKILNEIRIMMAALGLGLAKSAFETGIRYAKEREAFGRPISKFQLIQEKIAEMDTKITNSQLLTYYTAWLKDQGRPHYKEAAMAKFYSTETASFVVDEVTRIHGAYGIAKEYNAQRYFRDARFLLFGGGTSEILKIIIARERLKEAI